MVGLISDKLIQHPQLLKEIDAKGGAKFIEDSTHRPQDTGR